jgi:hypothetical protein
MSTRIIYSTCPSCHRRPGFFGYAVYRCPHCRKHYCDRCVRKGIFALRCPHCGTPSEGKAVGYTR